MRDALKAAALLGVEFAVPDLAIVLGRSVPELIPAVDEACAAGVLAESGTGLGFLYAADPGGAGHQEMPARCAPPGTGTRGAPWRQRARRRTGVARQLLRAADGPGGPTEPVDEWMLDWLARTADPLVGLGHPRSRQTSSGGPSPVPRRARPGTAGWPARRRPLQRR